MPPTKRGRPARMYDDEVDEEDTDSRRESHKRRRQDGDAIEQDGSSDSDPELTGAQRQRYSARDEYERERDEAETDAEEDAEIEKRATQDIRRAREEPVQNQVNEHGILESLFCTNFMCHKKLEVKFGPQINFIIGHNGSGKSAVLTAVTLCLGGKATATNRGQSLKGFIKEGEDTCMLQIKIKNQGDGAFRQDVYGNSITVERHFTLSGTSGFKLKASNGKVVSTKRAELDDITDFYSLQLDNPVNVLTQDQARQFLNNSSAADKYKFFMRGIQLEQLDHDYTLLADSLDAAEAHMDSIADDKALLQKALRQAEDKVELAAQQKTVRDQIHRYRDQMAWAQVEEQERLLEQAQQKVEKADRTIVARDEAVVKADEIFQTHHTTWAEAQVKLEEVRGELPALQSAQEEAQEICKNKNKDLVDLQTQQRDVKGKLEVAKKTVAKFQEDVDTERKRLEAADGGYQAQQMQKIEEAEANLADAHRKVAEHPNAKDQLDRDRNTIDLKLNDARNALRQKHDDVERAQSTLRQLNAGQPKPLSAYHGSISGVLSAINQERRWKSKPIGPLAEHVRLLKPEWSSAIEVTLGKSTLEGFIVETKADQVLLSAIMKRLGWYGQVFVGHKSHIDTTAQEPPPEFDTILRVLQVDNELVRNQLIINHYAEQVILIPDRKQAMSAMYPPNNGYPPRNVKFCITFDPNRRGWCIRYVAGNTTRSDPIHHYQGKQRVRTDTKAQINLQRDLVAGMRREAQPLEDLVRDLLAEQNRCQQAIKEHDKLSSSLRLAQKTAVQKVQSLKEQLEAAIPQDGKLDSLKDQLRSEEEERDHFQTQYDAASEARQGLNAEYQELEKTLNEATAQIASHTKRVERIQKVLTKSANDRVVALRAKNEANNSLTSAKQLKDEEEQVCAHQVENVKYMESEASKVCLRVSVDPGETTTSLDAKLGRLQDQLTNAETELGGTEAQLNTAAAEAKIKLKRAIKSWNSVNILRHHLQLTLRDRQHRWDQFKKQITGRARSHFAFLLYERQFRGRMEVWHKRKQLELRVEPDIASTRTDHGRGTKTLSGGEKSFSTICMLLALWESMGSPIRCLDEFDVFMDNVNRDISMNMIITAARRSVGRQYILISPQAMGNVNVAGDVKVHRMVDPERGQRVIGADGRVE